MTSKKQIGDTNLQSLRTWLERADRIPERNGRANISAIALSAGLDRQVLYRVEAREMIAAAVQEKGLGLPNQVRTASTEVPQWARQQIQSLETRLATAYADLADLRKRLMRYEHIERQMVQTGQLPR